MQVLSSIVSGLAKHLILIYLALWLDTKCCWVVLGHPTQGEPNLINWRDEKTILPTRVVYQGSHCETGYVSEELLMNPDAAIYEGFKAGFPHDMCGSPPLRCGKLYDVFLAALYTECKARIETAMGDATWWYRTRIEFVFSIPVSWREALGATDPKWSQLRQAYLRAGFGRVENHWVCDEDIVESDASMAAYLFGVPKDLHVQVCTYFPLGFRALAVETLQPWKLSTRNRIPTRSC